ncbi:MAG TPA: prepilin-type N-terminal cleavage/methylation domain-containing protein [Limnobacter sp.]|nr:prepilin-type N-terminal cleavage/methylation domain-containing protein [Limnobacter sp.]
MAKRTFGFTLMELSIGLALLSILLVAAIPSMNTILNKQALKAKVSRLDTYVDRARNLAAITECPVQMSLQPAAERIDVSVTVEHDPFLKGCSSWYSQTSSANNRGFSARLEDVSLTRAASLRFNAVSGVLDTQNQTQLTLSYRDKTVRISYLGIGNGVVIYE